MSILPAIQTIAQLSPRTLVTDVFHHSVAQLQASLSGHVDSEAGRAIAHEGRHWSDIVGTLWGQRYLDAVFEAFDDAMTHPPEAAFRSALRLFDLERAILFPAYYKYVAAGAPAGSTSQRWGISFTVGVRIGTDGVPDDSRPIYFVRFEHKGQDVGRQPLTVGALLEMRAMGAEIEFFRDWSNIADPTLAAADRLLVARSLRATVYQPEMLTYTTAAHQFGYSTGETNMIEALSHGSELAGAILNLKPVHFKRLVAPADLDVMPRARRLGFRTSADPGYAFACVSYWYRALRGQHRGPGALDAALALAGFPSYPDILSHAEAELRTPGRRRLRHARLQSLRTRLRSAGAAMLAERRATGRDWSILNPGRQAPLVFARDARLPLPPPIFDEDESYFLTECNAAVRENTRLAFNAGRGSLDESD